MALDTLLSRHARYRPDHLALVFEDTRLTASQLHARIVRVVNALNGLGLSKGDKVAIVLDNSLEVIDIYYAAAMSGIVVVPLSPMLRGEGLINLINDADTRVLITMLRLVGEIDAVRDRLEIAPDRFILTGPDEVPGYRSYDALVAAAPEDSPAPVTITDADEYNIIYSSGTTGLPKGIVHTHAVREAYCTGLTASFRIAPESVMLHSGSMVFNGAFLLLMPALYTGCTFVLMPGFDAEAMIDVIRAERATHIMLVPSQIIALLASPRFSADHVGSLEMVGSVGAPLHLEHKEEIARRLPGRFYELYGLTEGFFTILDRDDFSRKPASVGIPPPLYEMRMVDEHGDDVPVGTVGEIVGRGPVTMPGYYKRPDLTAEAIRGGWLYSGDLGYVDDDGFLFLADRKKDLIISGGVNVYPHDIEEVVIQHAAVLDVAVFGVDDPKWGEAPVAAVRLDEASNAGTEQIREWVNERLSARYQKVREVVAVEAFPLSVAGKTLRRVLRAEYSAPVPPPETDH